MGLWDRTSRFIGRGVSEVVQPAVQTGRAVSNFTTSASLLGTGAAMGAGGALLRAGGDIATNTALSADEYGTIGPKGFQVDLSELGMSLGSTLSSTGDNLAASADVLANKDAVKRTAVDAADAALSTSMATAFYANPELSVPYVLGQAGTDATLMQEDYRSPMDVIYSAKNDAADSMTGRDQETTLEAHLRRLREAREEAERDAASRERKRDRRERTLEEAEDRKAEMRETISGPAPMTTDTNTVHEHYATKASILAGPDGNQSIRGGAVNPVILLRSNDYQGIESQWNAWRASGGKWRGD